MKKTLVAVAALAVSSMAMAEATIFGIVDQAYNITSKTVSGTKTKTTSIDGAYTGSEIGFKGSEDLGNGLTANFQIQFAPKVDGNWDVVNGNDTKSSTGGLAAYQSFIGVSGGFGAVKVGKFYTPSFNHNASFDSVGYPSFGYNAGIVNGSATLAGNSIQYDLPTFVPGLGVSYLIGKGETAGSSNGDMSNLRLSYTTGPVAVGYTQATIKGASGTSTKDNSFGGSYDLGMAKLYYYQTSSKLSTAAKTNKGTALGISVPLGALTLAYQNSSAKVGATGTQDESTGNMIQAKYDLSKRTSVIFMNGSTRVTAGTNNGNKTSGTSIGLWHSF